MRVNYIQHLNHVCEQLFTDDRLTPHHISLYLVLFQFWNLGRFTNPVSIQRSETMRAAKIGSVNTYTKCLKELESFGYLQYLPSFNPIRGSKVNLYNFSKGGDKAGSKADDTSDDNADGMVVRPSINSSKQKKQTKQKERENGFHPPTLEEVISFFKSQSAQVQEGKKFFSYYQSNGWKVGQNEMKDWRAAAESWLLKSEKFEQSKSEKKDAGNYHATEGKDYSQPL